VEGRLPNQKLKKNTAERPKIRSEGVDSIISEELWSHIERTPTLSPRVSFSGRVKPISDVSGESKVIELQLIVFIEQDRGRPQIGIDDSV